MYFNHRACRVCGSRNLIPVLDLGIHPLANDFTTEDEEKAGFAPLKVLFCPSCTLAQLSVVVRPEIIYSNYPYVTSRSKTMRDHFDKLITDLGNECSLKSVCEIGSNTGDLLKQLKDECCSKVVGLDPARNLVKIANEQGVESIETFLTPAVASSVRRHYGPQSLILMRHVFAHMENWKQAISSVHTMSDRDTLVCIEAPWVMEQLEAVSFDVCYFEHLSYISVQSIVKLLIDTELFLYKVAHYPIHGGAITLLLKRRDSGAKEDQSVQDFLSRESSLSASRWEKFADETDIRILMLKNKVAKLRSLGKRVVGYAASAKSTAWVHACKFTKNDISAIYDETPQKQGKFVPGTDIPVLPESQFEADNPDYAINFGWNFRTEIEQKNKKWHDGGGRWIIPVPKIEIC